MTGAKITTPVSFLDILPLWALFHPGGGAAIPWRVWWWHNLYLKFAMFTSTLSWSYPGPSSTPPPRKVGMYSMAINVLISAHLQRVANRKRTDGPPPAMWRGVFSCALYLQEEQRVGCLHAAPTVTSLHGESSCQQGFLSPASLSGSLLDLLGGVIKHFSAQATIFKNARGRQTSPYLFWSPLKAQKLWWVWAGTPQWAVGRRVALEI